MAWLNVYRRTRKHIAFTDPLYVESNYMWHKSWIQHCRTLVCCGLMISITWSMKCISPYSPCLLYWNSDNHMHYSDIIISAIESQITGVPVVYSTVLKRRSKKIPKFRVTGLCEGNPLVTKGFPSQSASNAETLSQHARWIRALP